jgi:hypothetical protein
MPWLFGIGPSTAEKKKSCDDPLHRRPRFNYLNITLKAFAIENQMFWEVLQKNKKNLLFVHFF